jgi:hypothetical protein
MWHVQGRREVITSYWWGNLKETGHWKDVGVDGRIQKKSKRNRIEGRELGTCDSEQGREASFSKAVFNLGVLQSVGNLLTS